MNIYHNTTEKGRTSIEISGGEISIKTPWLKDFTPIDGAEPTDIKGEICKTLAVSHDNDELAVLCVYSEADGARLIPEGSHKITIRHNGKDNNHVLTYGRGNKLTLK